MKRKKVKKIIPYALATSLVLTGCGKKSECDIPTWHVHKYTSSVTKDITLEGYFHDEKLERKEHNFVYGTIDYHWNEENMLINKEDRAFYKKITDNDLIRADKNWDYLYNVMATQHDYLKFYWHYTTTETYTDSEGHTHTRTKHHQGWSEDPKHSHNTGKTVVCHHKYFAFRIVNKNGKWIVEQSPLVDDIRKVLDDYPYVDAFCYEEVESDYMDFNKSELPDLRVEEITPFRGPDLTQTGIELTPTKTELTSNTTNESSYHEFNSSESTGSIIGGEFIPNDDSNQTGSSFIVKQPYTKK